MTTNVDRLTTDDDAETGTSESEAEVGGANDDSSASQGRSESEGAEPTGVVAEGPALERDDPEGQYSSRARVSISVRGLVFGAIIALLVATIGVLGWLYLESRHTLDAQALKADNYAHAEKIALDYAVNAAAMNASDLGAWKSKLVAGTTPELNDKLTKAATSMEQILVPLQWNSTATPLAAKVRSTEGSIYIVDAFVSVQTKTVQSPDPLQSTAAYSITIDSGKDWQISDVGGIGAMVSGN